MYCMKCGAKNNEQAAFCSECGFKFTNIENIDETTNSVKKSFKEYRKCRFCSRKYSCRSW